MASGSPFATTAEVGTGGVAGKAGSTSFMSPNSVSSPFFFLQVRTRVHTWTASQPASRSTQWSPTWAVSESRAITKPLSVRALWGWRRPVSGL